MWPQSEPHNLKKIIADKLKTQIYENVIKRALEEERMFEDAYFEENEEKDTIK